MTSSGTTAFNPAYGKLMQYAYSLCGIRRTEITQEHLADAAMALNLMMSAWDNSTPNLWLVAETVQTLVGGTATYNVASNVVTVLDAFIRTFDTQGNPQQDRIIWPISRTEYASIPNKTTQAPPTVFWFDRLLSPTITLWQVPPVNTTTVYELHYYVVTQIQDAGLANGETADLPVWWLDAVSWGLAARLAVSYAPDRAVALDAKAKESLQIARDQNVETSNTLYFSPAIMSYYTR